MTRQVATTQQPKKKIKTNLQKSLHGIENEGIKKRNLIVVMKNKRFGDVGKVNWVVRMRGDSDYDLCECVSTAKDNLLGISIPISSSGWMCDYGCDEKVREIWGESGMDFKRNL
ncbi:hypothetical protein Dsin_016197 [Dipteronia sinensis]|uniref:Uncharacterized protein n=1 Tax=Dipteronia sinensis TaxID=43782 RepID=A0AAE0E599_9ROSI|nr:hypothetical protein Dsin_016197 [Dipteronia sinensis]